MSLTPSEVDMIVESLSMRKNWMETGNPVLSANDAISMRKREIIRPLDKHQRAYLVKIDKLIDKLQGVELE